MKIAIVTTGDEILQGIIVDTNSAWAAERCHLLGHEVVYHSSVGDDFEAIGNALKTAAEMADCVIVSGGLGPTIDDITIEAAARAFDVKLNLDEEVLSEIRNFFERVGRPMSKTNEKQAMIPDGGKALSNDVGTAPGIQVKLGGSEFFFLPGVPRELYPMFENHVVPWLKKKVKQRLEMRVLRCFGMPEAGIDELLQGLDLKGAHLGFRVKYPEILLKIIARFDDEKRAKKTVDAAVDAVKARLSDVVYAEGEMDMPRLVGHMLRDKSMSVAVAESCTGGLLCSMITDVPGASDYFERGVVSYSNQSKQELLGVTAETLRAHGAVSRETAMAMAEGIRRISRADIGVGITGIAGPGGGTPEKPVGLVHIACASGMGTDAAVFQFQGERERVKQITAMSALNMVRKYLLNMDR